jgi:hypothetical protein
MFTFLFRIFVPKMRLLGRVDKNGRLEGDKREWGKLPPKIDMPPATLADGIVLRGKVHVREETVVHCDDENHAQQILRHG